MNIIKKFYIEFKDLLQQINTKYLIIIILFNPFLLNV